MSSLADLNWNLLRSFCVIVEEQGITRAARRMNMSQPSVSMALQKLEDQLNCKLILRGSRHFSLTPRGTLIYEECAEILRNVDRIAVLARDRDCDDSGELRLSIVSQLHSPLIDEALRLFHQRFPTISWRIEVRTSLDTIRLIAEEKTGIGFCLLTRPAPTLECLRLFREAFGIFCGTEHPLFGQTRLDPAKLVTEAFVAFQCVTEGKSLEPMEQLRDQLGLGRRISGSSHDLDEVRRMIIAGLGIGILPTTAAAAAVEAGQLWALDLIDQPLGADVYLVHTASNTLGSPEKKFVSILNELRALYPEMA